jgi:hypothetical protein
MRNLLCGALQGARRGLQVFREADSADTMLVFVVGSILSIAAAAFEIIGLGAITKTRGRKKGQISSMIRLVR